MLAALEIPPGVARMGTTYQLKNRWYDASMIRWYEGTMRPIGGWRNLKRANGTNLQLTGGVPRSAIAFRSHSTSSVFSWFVVTNATKVWAFSRDPTLTELYDITPASGFTTGTDSTVVPGVAYGKGAYGVGPYSAGSIVIPGTPGTVTEQMNWSVDTFGNILVAAAAPPSDGKLWQWDSSTPGTPMILMAGSPTNCRAVVVTPERFVFALATNNNPRRVQWASQESLTIWTPSSSNSAGDWDIETTGRLVAGRRTARETLLWTDIDLHAAIYIGGTLIYQFERRGHNCGAISPHCMAMIGDVAVWWSHGGFYIYEGAVKALNCEVGDYVFGRLNEIQKTKVYAIPIGQYGEVWWFYPSTSSEEVDSYVVYNYREDHWSVGSLARTSGFDRGAWDYPVMFDASGFAYEHEYGHDRTGTVYAETGPLEIPPAGRQTFMLRELFPDERTLGDVQAKFYTTFYPTQAETLSGAYSLANPTSIRLTARQMRMRVEESAGGTDKDWRVGTIRVDVAPHGDR